MRPRRHSRCPSVPLKLRAAAPVATAAVPSRPPSRMPRPSLARAYALAALATLTAAVGCQDLTFREESPATARYAASLNVNLTAMTTTASGLYLQDVAVGSGAVAAAGDTVRTYYIGYLTSGAVFDSTRSPAQPLSFPLGAGVVIRGWDEGLVGMRAGGRRRLIIPPGLAYGRSTRGSIPAGSVLVFDIDLVSVGKRTTTPPAGTASAAAPTP